MPSTRRRRMLDGVLLASGCSALMAAGACEGSDETDRLDTSQDAIVQSPPAASIGASPKFTAFESGQVRPLAMSPSHIGFRCIIRGKDES